MKKKPVTTHQKQKRAAKIQRRKETAPARQEAAALALQQQAEREAEERASAATAAALDKAYTESETLRMYHQIKPLRPGNQGKPKQIVHDPGNGGLPRTINAHELPVTPQPVQDSKLRGTLMAALLRCAIFDIDANEDVLGKLPFQADGWTYSGMLQQIMRYDEELLQRKARVEIDKDGEQGPTGKIYLEGDERPAFFLRY